MKNKLLLTLATAVCASAQANLIISEIHSTGSAAAGYAADWFELSNTGALSIDITGWKVDDSSSSFASAFALTGPTAIGAGQSVIFLETANLAVTQTSFVASWFNGLAPGYLVLGSYTGSSIGLSSGGDAVNIFNSAGVLQANVTFGTATGGTSFDNAAGLTGAVSTLSVAGVNDAFLSVPGGETGSPGVVPEPGTFAVLLSGLGVLALRRRRR